MLKFLNKYFRKFLNRFLTKNEVESVQRQIPTVLRTRKVELPEWAKITDSNSKVSIKINADTDGYVKEWFSLLGVTNPDHYWLEVAYQCAKMDLQRAIENTAFDPRYAGKAAEFHFSGVPQWSMNRFQVGRGTGPASQGGEARKHFERIRGGKVPF
jgi:hypothetical protein